jgi:ParB/RepB/Spo0J family partition protein
VPIVVVALEKAQGYLVIDGFKRLRCLEQLKLDTVNATLLDLPESDALVLDRSQRSSEGLCELEQGWLLSALREQGLSQEELAQRFDKSPSWVSRRLALVSELPLPVQEQVRQGAIPAHAAMRHLVPIARRHRKDCLRLSSAIAGLKLTSREVGELCRAWLASSPEVRARLLGDPRLFLRARKRRQEPPPLPAALELMREIDRLTQTARRLTQRLRETDLNPKELAELRQALRPARAELDAFDEEIHHAGETPSRNHPGAVEQGCLETSNCQTAQDLAQHRGEGDPVADGATAKDPPAGESRAPSRRDPGVVLDMPGQSRAGSRGATGPGRTDLILRPDRLLPPPRHRDDAQATSGEIPLRAGSGDSARHLAPQG